MKAINLFTVLTLLFTINFTNAQNIPCSQAECDFQKGEQVYVFGNDVKLRAQPSTSSKVLELLKIGEWVEILEKTEFSWPYRGFESPFYKVKYDQATGYILGGLLSGKRKTLNGKHYYFALAKEGEQTFMNVRHVKNGTYHEKKVRLKHTDISIKVLDDKGLPGLDGILYLDYLSEACGVESGGVYLFVQGGDISNMASLSRVAEAGVYYRSEQFIFPFDKGGLPDKVLFKKEQGEVFDETTNWTKTTVEIRELSWVNGELVPNFRQKPPSAL
ncbi:SH3 domain-containing protein [Flagellimonas flava]|uniref:SH3 domain-containing protein n=1 Tax=Flagellimonas flava TaxID=570519 RepID=A0A1M5JUC8_9FLAO|nr:SH3 domain-containing protein [Allomuricauda flava]SHG43869.1 SH3 domain-containing protein [Allomuricauda flava]